MLSQNLNFEGKISYKVFDKDGNLKEQVTGIKNFITNTGLSYLSNFAFADTFRCISLGTGTNPNFITGIGTTGLSSGLSEFMYLGPRTVFSDPTTSAYENPGCGYTELQGGVTLSRSWRVPATGFFDNNYVFNEIMLSPGRPTGSLGLCGCQFGNVNGVDASIVADYYDSNNTSICKANKAFSRILYNLSVNSQDFTIISYDLTVNYTTGVNLFNTTITSPINNNWSGSLKGRSSIIHHGLKLINDGSSTDESSIRNQQDYLNESYVWGWEYGESFIPLWGMPYEPSCVSQNLVAYFSTDNIQFLVNQSGGGPIITGNWQPWNPTGFVKSSGLMTSLSNPSDNNNSQLFNIRTPLTGPIFPSQSDYTTQGTNLPDLNYILDSTSNKTNNMLSYVASGRSRSMLYPFTFNGLNAGNTALINPFGGQTTWDGTTSSLPSVRSLVLAYTDTNSQRNNILYPFWDVLFSGIAGEGLVPTGAGRTISNPSNDYFFLEGGLDVTIVAALTWSSPCDSSVIGC